MAAMPDFFVQVDGPRGDVLERVLGSRRVPILGPLPVPCELPIGVRECYILDVGALDFDQFWRLTEHLVQAFASPIEAVQEELRNKGMPILAEACSVTILNPQKWL
jgi:hypothetical protein